MNVRKLNIRGKLRFVVSVGSATAFLLFALLSLSAVFQIYLTINDGSQELSDNMANYAENFTLTAEQNRLEEVAQNRAEIIYQEIRFVQEDVDYLSCRVSDILKNPQNYSPRSLPISNYQKVTSKTPYVHFSPSLMKNNLTDDILAEIRLLSNIADDQKFLSDYYDAIFIGSEKGYTIMLHVMQNDDDITPLSEEPQINSYDPRERIWYKLGMAEKKSAFTEVYIGTKGTPCFSCAMPYYDAQGIAGILGVDVNLSSIQELVEKTATNEDETNFILGNNGEILFSTKKRGFLSFGGLNNDLRKLADEEISNVAKRMVAGESSVLPIKIEGNDYFIAFAPIPKLSWSFATIIDKNSMIQPTIDARNRNAERMENFRQSIVLMLLAFLTGAGIFMLILLKMFAKGSGKLAEKFSRPILELTDGVKEISDGNLDKKFDIKTANEIEDLAICMNAMTDELKKEMARVERVTAEKERTMTDILVAASIQRDMLPNMFPPFPQRHEFDIFAMMRAAREVGGDFYDFYLIDDDKLALIIADIKGKGVPAALFMVIAKTLFKNFIMMIKNPEELRGAITIANDKLCENNEQNMSVTVFAAILEISTGKFTYINAGHTSPLVYKKSEKIYSFLPSPKEKTPLGINNGLFFSTDTINFATGDKIFMYNNSVLKIIDENGNTFGKKNLAEALNKNISVSVTETINILDTEIKNFVGNKEQSDDITMVALEYFGAGNKEAKS